MGVMRLGFVHLRVTDLEEARNHYSNTLGMTVVAEQPGRIVGSNFMDERSPILGVGPISVDPAVQNGGIGRRLMQDVLDRAAAKNARGVRLVQAAR